MFPVLTNKIFGRCQHIVGSVGWTAVGVTWLGYTQTETIGTKCLQTLISRLFTK